MFDPILMVFAKFLGHALFILVVKVEIAVGKLCIFLDHLVKYIDIERQPFGAVQLLDQLSANWAADPVLVVQLRNAVCAKGVPAVN